MLLPYVNVDVWHVI